ncbi:MAG TPA: carbohydrate-binding family 9-like protein [Thermoanaerobaculia bacterium]|nr:carbohydrate-binding family 9-like protein [Thermoanaerobaculia bacterium]
MTRQAPPRHDLARLATTDRLVGLASLSLTSALDGSPPRLATRVRIGLRSGMLLVRFDGRDAGRVATRTERDGPLWEEDVFEVFLSPHDPAAVYYEFEVNPLGALLDARIESPDLRRETMRVETAWNCPGFSARVRLREKRWSALLRIPLAPMESGEPAATWRANFFRVDRGARDEYSAWSPTFVDPPNFHAPEKFGFLRIG